MNESDIFIAAVQIEEPSVRTAFLDSVCLGDMVKRLRLERMIAQYGSWQCAWDGFSNKLAERFIESIGTSGSEPPTNSDSDPTDHAGGQVGNYEILHRLGSGGMGDVYLANDLRLGRRVALKILRHQYSHSPQWVQRFEREARAASALNHPNILTIYEIGQAEGVHFIVTEFIDGRTLHSLAKIELTLSKRLDIALQIAEALNIAHTAGVVHRDIKPENVMLRTDGLVKVLDFGIAKYYPPTAHGKETTLGPVTDPGIMMGTIRYMSPEQARRDVVDLRADLYSLGVLFFELLTGALPYPSAKDAPILSALLSDQPLQLSALADSPYSNLESILKKLLRKDREERYQSAKELIIDLKHVRRECERSAVDLRSITAPTASLLSKADTNSNLRGDTDIQVPEVRYARSGDVNIAYQIVGKGEIDLVFVMGWVSHLDWFWKEPTFASFLMRLASFARLILFDKRGTGLSDRVPHDQLPTLEQRMDDVRAVMDAAGSEHAVLCGVSEGGPMCSLFAATYPQKTLALVVIGSYARRLLATDYPWGPSEEQHAMFLDEIARNWGGPVGIEARAPSRANDSAFCSWWATYLRMGASPGAVLALTKMNAQIDIRHILKSIQVPTLVLHRTGDRCLKVEEGRFLADEIPGAKFVALEGNDHLPFVGNQDDFLDPMAEFLTGLKPNQRVHRILTTVLCAQVRDSADSTTPQFSQHIGMSRFSREIELFRGQTIQSTQQRILASFDGPARAIRAALAIRESAVRLGIQVQVGLHTGECDMIQNQLSGPAVDLAISVVAHSEQNQVVVSSTVKDLVAGSGLQFISKTHASLSDELPNCALFQVTS
jgi:serine/threonine protein kinase